MALAGSPCEKEKGERKEKRLRSRTFQKNDITQDVEMLKKWMKFLKILATTLILLVYLTMEIYDRETLKGEKNKRRFNFPTESTPTAAADKYSGTVKTIVSYSREYRLRKEMEDRIECEASILPERGKSGATTQWRQDRNLGIRLFSAYYDRRQDPHHYVRTIGLMPRNLSLYCQIWYETDDAVTHVTQKAIGEEIWSPSWERETEKCEEEYPVIISCLAPHQNGSNSIAPSWVSFVDKNCVGGQTFTEITSSPPPSAKKNFVVCVKPLHFTHLNEKTFREWMEINYRLGADEIVVYLYNLTNLDSISGIGKETGSLVRKRFEYPKSDCPSRNFKGSVWYRRKLEIIAYNDCFYGNLYSAKFVIPLDVDEIIVPKTGNSWTEAFRSHFRKSDEEEIFWPENYASFSVRNAYFFSKYPGDAKIFRELPNRMPKKLVKFLPRRRKIESSGSIFDRTLRSYRLSPKSDSVKSFVHVTKTLSVFNHFTFHVLKDATQQYIFPQTVFQLNHYRNSCDPILIDGCRDFLNHVVYDDSLEKFRRREKISKARKNQSEEN